jgi:predicted alpha/beta-hydrolase family hydrolase
MRTYSASAPVATFVFAHGAGAGEQHPWMVRVAKGLAERGITVVTFNFPYKEAGKSAPDRPPVLEAAFEKVWNEVAAKTTGRIFAGGKSMGGRIASQVAAKGGLDPTPAGLVFFGYPLHPPAKPAQRRDAHLPAIKVPMLFLSGAKDPFGTPDEFRELVGGLSRATLEVFDGGDHSIQTRRKGDDLVASAIDHAAQWIIGD